jgi:hypothetical protein
MRGNFVIPGKIITNTGTAVNVCLGDIPAALILFEVTDATNAPIVFWMRSLTVLSAAPEGGIMIETIANLVGVLLTSATGIAPYAGGTVLVYDGVTDNRWETTAGADATTIYQSGNGGCVFDVLTPKPWHGERRITPPGFTVGTNSHLNPAAGVLHFIALMAGHLVAGSDGA